MATKKIDKKLKINWLSHEEKSEVVIRKRENDALFGKPNKAVFL